MCLVEAGVEPVRVCFRRGECCLSFMMDVNRRLRRCEHRLHGVCRDREGDGGGDGWGM